MNSCYTVNLSLKWIHARQWKNVHVKASRGKSPQEEEAEEEEEEEAEEEQQEQQFCNFKDRDLRLAVKNTQKWEMYKVQR